MKRPSVDRKKSFGYRKGSTNEAVNCKWCKDFRLTSALAGRGFCRMLFFEKNVEHMVREDHRCDKQVTTYVPPRMGR